MSDGVQSARDDGAGRPAGSADTGPGAPPLHVVSARSSSPRTLSPARLYDASSPKRPATSPGPRASAPWEDKRDSGIAPSVSTADRASLAESTVSSTVLAAPVAPNVPTIVVQDNEAPAPIERSRSPLGRLRRKSPAKEPAVPAQSPLRSQSTPSLQRVKSFKGIQANIPTGKLDDIHLEDLASDKIGFSQRGSLLLGGKKMNELIAAQGDGEVATNAEVESSLSSPSSEAAAQAPEGEAARDAAERHSPRRGLVAGRRNPSMHMLQAALHGHRVLSTEEVTLSTKVRNMYEYGDEQAAEWTGSAPSSAPRPMSTIDTVTDELATDNNDASTDEKRRFARDSSALQAPAARNVRASMIRDPHEFAGGIEDWRDVDSKDIDRYGFIVPKALSSRPSTSSTTTPNGDGFRRIATALRFENEQPRRKLQRGAASKRSSRSVPPPRPSADGTVRTFTGSVRSFRSIDSRRTPGLAFRSKDRRTLAEAANMLSVPDGLAQITERSDTRKTGATLKRREWAREEKWQRMARPVGTRSGSKGGGMRFEFDTQDPKLIERTWKGIPDRWRATAWHSFLARSAQRRGVDTSDEELIAEFHQLQERSCADDVQIDVDVPRTISMHIMFRRRYRGGQRLLFRVLHAISLYCPEPGYVQGMASLAATLLSYYDEEEAFVMMVRLWQLRGLEQLFMLDEDGLIAALDEFQREWLRGGDVAQKLEELCVPATSYGTRWYLTLFNLSIPFQAQLRIWDVFMLLGDAPGGLDPRNHTNGDDDNNNKNNDKNNRFGGADLDVLHAASAALIDAMREIILDADFENAMKVLTSYIPIHDDDLLMRVARTEYKMRKKRAGGRA